MGEPLTEKSGVTATKIGQRASLLLIDPAGWSHSGQYACVARNPAGLANYTATLEVHGTKCLPSTELCVALIDIVRFCSDITSHKR